MCPPACRASIGWACALIPDVPFEQNALEAQAEIDEENRQRKRRVVYKILRINLQCYIEESICESFQQALGDHSVATSDSDDDVLPLEHTPEIDSTLKLIETEK